MLVIHKTAKLQSGEFLESLYRVGSTEAELREEKEFSRDMIPSSPSSKAAIFP